MLLTVAICTWNRARLLDTILLNMHKLETPKDVEWELLVVNNNSTDDTDEVLSRHTEHFPLRRLFEEKLGQVNARNCAINAARGDLIIREYYRARGMDRARNAKRFPGWRQPAIGHARARLKMMLARGARNKRGARAFKAFASTRGYLDGIFAGA